MKRKIPTPIIIISVFATIVVITCFCLGFKIPQFDNHKKWTTLDDNKDSRFSIDKVTDAYVLVDLENPKQFVCYGDSVRIISESGEIKHVFKTETDDILIDKINNRLIEQATTFEKWKTEVDSVFVIDLKNYSKKRVPITENIVSETYEDFKKRLGIVIVYDVSKAKEFTVADSLCSLKYMASQKKYIAFLNTLSPVIQLDNKYGGRHSRVAFYSNKQGELFKIVSSDVITSDNFESYMRSLDKLWPNWNAEPNKYEFKFKTGNFALVAKSRVMGNDLTSDLYFTNIRFEQNYVNYYAIKLKDSVLNFKMFDHTHIIYLEKNLQDFDQLNVPKSDRDTLAFVYGNYLYRVYLKKR
ncbi:hypothetical protein EZJ43_13310 [Pedobacter changchengzhani]|uniref:Uncharacterized protein n=1 Tax=Pedobacter changchengzhani TaxID=2529274 RepID=A0A4R5MJ12_9SPHI|nr:hypothetical protein [Pedobacter changchengzhani]TDG35594.1 hypothetical protein EZJ43_13310 [Pedobacter changchengzhani]